MEALMDFNRMFNGMIRAMRLDKTFFEEVENDTSYNRDALWVVILVSLIGSVGSFIGSLMLGRSFFSALGGMIVSLLLALLGYFLWVFVAHWVGTTLFKGSGDRGEVQRAFGFAYSPQIINILAFIPCVGGLIGLVAWIWSVIAGFVAIRQSMDQDNANAALTVIVSAVIVFVVIAVLSGIFAAMGLGVAAITGALTG
jgi:hypothetical protein